MSELTCSINGKSCARACEAVIDMMSTFQEWYKKQYHTTP